MRGSPVILITGASGFIGSRVTAELYRRARVVATFHTNSRVRIAGVDHRTMDVTDAESVHSVFSACRPDVVVHIAGTKDLLACERSPAFAYRSHVTGTRNVVEASQGAVSRLIYVSTDCVFDGSKEFFSEEDHTRPINVYGSVKLEGERLVAESGVPALIARASLVYGWQFSGQGSNTVVDAIRAGARRSVLRLASTLYNTPVFVDDLARILAEAALRRDVGVIHVAGVERLTRYELGTLAVGAFGFDSRRVIEAVRDHSGIRPANSCLRTLLGERFHIKPRSVRDGLETMRKQFRNRRVRRCVMEILAQSPERRL